MIVSAHIHGNAIYINEATRAMESKAQMHLHEAQRLLHITRAK